MPRPTAVPPAREPRRSLPRRTASAQSLPVARRHRGADQGSRDRGPGSSRSGNGARAARRDLRLMGNDQHLRLLGQPRQALADRAGDRAADPAIDLVEDHRARTTGFSQRDLEREDEARQLAAAGDLGQRAERRAGVGRNLELDAVDTGGTRLGLRSAVRKPCRSPASAGEARPRRPHPASGRPRAAAGSGRRGNSE